MALRIERVNQATAEEARGIVIVIDVVRAFSVAGYAFAGGAQAMWLVRTVDEARRLREYEPQALLVGEVTGRTIAGFDLNNSPSLMAHADVQNRLLIQRTGAGTQGAVKAQHAHTILLCALTNANATVRYARTLAEQTGEPITLLPTATVPGRSARNEDDICADYLQALLEEHDQASTALQQGIAYLHESGRFKLWHQGHPDFPADDIPAVLAADCFKFAMLGTQRTQHDINYVEVQRIDIL